MNDIFKSIEKMSDEPVAANIHNRIMLSLFYRKYRVVFSAISAMVTVNFLFSSWQAVKILIDADVVSIFRSLADSFEISGSYLSDAVKTTLEALPAYSLVSSLTSSILLVYLFFIYISFKKLEAKVEDI